MIYKVENISSYSESDYEKAFATVSPERQQKALRYKSTNDRKRCIFSAVLLRDMLINLCGVEESKLKFTTDEKGKPHLADNSIHFNISHSGDFVACAVDSQPVGIDIEVPREVDVNVINRICTKEEIEYVFSGFRKEVADREETLRFLQIWTAKEAYLKYTGEGLSGGIKNISVATSEGMKETLSAGQKLISKSEKDYTLAIVTDDT